MSKPTWRVAKSLLKLFKQINTACPSRSRVSDGTIGDAAHSKRQSDHNPWVKDGNVGVVTAIDVTHDPERGCDAGEIVKELVASRDPRIKYIIYNRQIISSSVEPWKWRKYRGANPHTKHFHISVSSNKNLYDDERDWTVFRRK